MSKLVWDATGDRVYETGVDHGVLYVRDDNGDYPLGVAWSGLTTVTESPSGAESTKTYADNIVYLNLISVEEFSATIEAYTYPDEFAACDGSAELVPGVFVGQQDRKTFGFAYRTIVGNDTKGNAYGHKLHLVYGATAAPSEKAHATVNDSPEAVTFSWDVSTIPTEVGTLGGNEYKPTATITVDSTKVDEDAYAALEAALFGTSGADPYLPSPAEVYAMFSGTLTTVATTAPTYNSSTDIVTIPGTTGVIYSVDGEDVPAGPYGPITETIVVNARPAAGYRFTDTSDTDFTINFA